MTPRRPAFPAPASKNTTWAITPAEGLSRRAAARPSAAITPASSSGPRPATSTRASSDEASRLPAAMTSSSKLPPPPASSRARSTSWWSTTTRSASSSTSPLRPAGTQSSIDWWKCSKEDPSSPSQRMIGVAASTPTPEPATGAGAVPSGVATPASSATLWWAKTSRTEI